MLQDRVVAFLLEDMIQGAEWKIEHVPQHGTDAYMCETSLLLSCPLCMVLMSLSPSQHH